MLYPYAPGTTIKSEFWAVFGPEVRFDWHDQEPGPAALTSSVIRGLSSPPLLGSMLQMAFIGQGFDTYNFDAHTTVDDFGDGGAVGDGRHHTYTTPGGWWIKKNGPTGAVATRFVRAVYEVAPTGGASLDPLQYGYPCTIDQSKGNVNDDFTFSITINIKQANLPESSFGLLANQSMVGVFCRQEIDGVVGPLTLVAGGFTTDPDLVIGAGVETLTFNCRGIAGILSEKTMRPCSFIDPGIIGLLGIALNSFSKQELGQLLFGDFAGAGYNMSHWIKCAPEVVVLHLLTHVRVYAVSNGTSAMPASPSMQSTRNDTEYDYGNLAQFANLELPPGVTDDDNTAAFHSLSVQGGNVLENMRNLSRQQGYLGFFSRHGLTLRLARMSFFEPGAQPTEIMQIPDETMLPVKAEILPGNPVYISKIIMQKPLLLDLSKSVYNEVIYDPDGNPIVYPRNPVDTLNNIGSSFFDQLNAQAYGNAKALETAGIEHLVQDILAGSVKGSSFQIFYPNPANSVGTVEGPLEAVLCTDPDAYLKGYYKRLRAQRWVKLRLGPRAGIGLYDGIRLSLVRTQLGINWSLKLFKIMMTYITIANGLYDISVDAQEADPDE